MYWCQTRPLLPTLPRGFLCVGDLASLDASDLALLSYLSPNLFSLGIMEEEMAV
jgi:hypothetical protein